MKNRSKSLLLSLFPKSGLMIPLCGLIVLSPQDWAMMAMFPQCLRWPPLVLSLCNNKHRPWPRISIHMYKCTLHVILFTYIHSTCTNVHSDSDIALHSHKRSTRSGYVCLFQWLGYHTKDMIRAFSGRAQTEISENNGKEEPIMHLGLLRNCLVFLLGLSSIISHIASSMCFAFLPE